MRRFWAGGAPAKVDFQAALNGYGKRSSLSRKGDCWDNAPTEGVWSSLKVEQLYGKRFATHRELMNGIIDLLMSYNHRRLHSKLGCVSPMNFEANWRAGQLNNAASPSGYELRRTGARPQPPRFVVTTPPTDQLAHWA